MSKKLLILCFVLGIGCAMPIAYYGFTALRHYAQAKLAETHALLSGEDGEDIADNEALDVKTFKKLDSTVNPLKTIEGAISWKLLAKAKLEPVAHDPNHAVKPVFTPDIQKLDHQDIVAQGFMFPLDSNEKQSHFVISPYPVSCPYCMPAGPNELIEVFSKKPVKFSYDPIALKGEFKLLSSSDEIREGMLYQMNKATIVSN